MRNSFVTAEKPLITAMVLERTPEAAIEKVRLSLEGGAEAIGFQLEKLERKYRDEAVFRRLFEACEGKPIYVCAYRNGSDSNYTDEECAECLRMALSAGATLLDVFGDIFGPAPYYQLAEDPEAVRRQKELIREIHAGGGEVLISCHTFKSLSVGENLMIARTQAERGADVIKIVDVSNDDAELPGYIESIRRIQEETGRKLLFLVSGRLRILREIGPSLGVCMYLTVHHHGEFDTPEQPLLADVVAIDSHMRRLGQIRRTETL